MTSPADSAPTADADEFQLLAGACASVLHEEASRNLQVDAQTDWENFLALAERHRVTALAAFGLAKANIIMPAPVGERLQKAQFRAQCAEAMSAAEVSRVAAAMEKADVPVILLKGIGISLAAFGRLGLRYNSDIDLLVDRNRVDAAEAVLHEAGYTRIEPAPGIPDQDLGTWRQAHKDSVFFNAGTQSLVELHWRLFDNRHLLQLPAGTWTNASHIAMRGFQIRSLPRQFEICYLCVHGAQHAWSRLKWLMDVDGILSKLSPDQHLAVLNLAKTMGVERAVAQAMLLRERILGVELDPVIRAAIPSGRAIDALVSLALRCLKTGGAQEIEAQRFATTAKNISHYLVKRNLRYRLSEFWFDLNDGVNVAVPRPLRWLAPVLRPWLWLKGQRRLKRLSDQG